MHQRPYHLLLFTGLALISTSFFVSDNNHVVDLHFSDTYIIIPLTYIFWLSAIIALIVWGIYLLTNIILYSKALSWIHISITILTLAIFVLSLYSGKHIFNQTPKRYYDFSIWDSSGTYSRYNIAFVIITGLFIIGQIVFIINFLTGLFKRKTQQ